MVRKMTGNTVRKAAATPAAKPATRTRRKAAAEPAPAPAPKPRARRTKPVADDTPKQSVKELAANASVAAALTGSDAATLQQFFIELKALSDRFINQIDNGSVPTGADDDGPVVADDSVTDTPQTRDEREDELLAWSVKDLQAALIATELFAAAEIRGVKDKDVLVRNLLAVEFGDDDAEDDDDTDADDQDDDGQDVDDDDAEDGDDEDDADDDEEELDSDALMQLSLAQLKKVAVDKYDLNAADLKGLDKEAIVGKIEELYEDADDEDGDDDQDDDADDSGDGEDDFYTAEELEEMTPKQLKVICDENGIAYGRTTSKEALIAKIMA